MAFKSEAEVWADERRKVAERRSARGRAFVRWFVRLEPEVASPQPDHFAWRSVADLMPIPGDEL